LFCKDNQFDLFKRIWAGNEITEIIRGNLEEFVFQVLIDAKILTTNISADIRDKFHAFAESLCQDFKIFSFEERINLVSAIFYDN
jgi:hypothetical protein